MVIRGAEGGEEGGFLLFDSCVGVGGCEGCVMLKELRFKKGELIGVFLFV